MNKSNNNRNQNRSKKNGNEWAMTYDNVCRWGDENIVEWDLKSMCGLELTLR